MVAKVARYVIHIFYHTLNAHAHARTYLWGVHTHLIARSSAVCRFSNSRSVRSDSLPTRVASLASELFRVRVNVVGHVVIAIAAVMSATKNTSFVDTDVDLHLKISNYEETVRHLDIYYGIGKSSEFIKKKKNYNSRCLHELVVWPIGDVYNTVSQECIIDIRQMQQFLSR